MKKIFLKGTLTIIIAMFLFPLYSFSPSKHELIPSGHWIYDAITALALEAGDVTLVQNAPLSIAEITLYLEDINRQELSKVGVQTYHKILNYFAQDYPAYGNDIMSFGTNVIVTPEFRYISNLDMYNENELTIDYVERTKLLEVPLIVNFNDYGVIRMNLSVATNFEGFKNPNVFFNVPHSFEYFDGNFPQTSYISTGLFAKNGKPFFNFQLGQNQISVGRTETGSVFVSDSLYGANYAQMSFFTENLRYSNTPIQLESNKYLYLHRIEFRIAKRVVVGLLEGVLVSQPFELRFLNPASIFHNINSWANYYTCECTINDETSEHVCNSELAYDSHSTAYFGATIDINPWKYMRFYGILAMNQFSLKSEITDNDMGSSFANALGAQVGLETFVPINDGYIHGAIEGVYNVPWLYKGKEQSPSPSFYNSTVTIGTTARNWLQTWVGYPYGPDTIVGFVKLGYNAFEDWSAYISYRYMVNGEVSFDTPYPTTEDGILATTPYGTPIYEQRIGLDGSYRIYDWLTTKGNFAYVISQNAQNIINNMQTGFECSLSVSMALSPFLLK